MKSNVKTGTNWWEIRPFARLACLSTGQRAPPRNVTTFSHHQMLLPADTRRPDQNVMRHAQRQTYCPQTQNVIPHAPRGLWRMENLQNASPGKLCSERCALRSHVTPSVYQRMPNRTKDCKSARIYPPASSASSIARKGTRAARMAWLSAYVVCSLKQLASLKIVYLLTKPRLTVDSSNARPQKASSTFSNVQLIATKVLKRILMPFASLGKPLCHCALKQRNSQRIVPLTLSVSAARSSSWLALANARAS